MNVVVQSSDLVKELTILERMVNKKPTLPILANVLLQATDGWLHMSATDLEVSLVTACQATVAMQGSITLPAKRLMEIAKTLPGEITLTLEKGQVRLTGGGFNSRLQALGAADFPHIAMPEGESIKLPRRALLNLIKQIQFAINEGNARHLVRGALLTLPENAFGLVATDSHRLALSSEERVGPAQEPILLPAKTLEHLAGLLSDAGDGDLEFTRTERHLFFEMDGRIMVSRQVDGKFPAYERIVPKDSMHVCTADRLGLAMILKRQMLIDEDVTLTFEDNAIDANATSAEIGDAIERLAVDYTGPKINIKFNGQYVVEFLEAARSKDVMFSLKDNRTPMLLMDGNYINVVMGKR